LEGARDENRAPPHPCLRRVDAHGCIRQRADTRQVHQPQGASKDTPKPELIKIMRQFAGDLGVRCGHCHYAKSPEDFSTFNFASDQNRRRKSLAA
jgi:hypothetical protein